MSVGDHHDDEWLFPMGFSLGLEEGAPSWSHGLMGDPHGLIWGLLETKQHYRGSSHSLGCSNRHRAPMRGCRAELRRLAKSSIMPLTGVLGNGQKEREIFREPQWTAGIKVTVLDLPKPPGKKHPCSSYRESHWKYVPLGTTAYKIWVNNKWDNLCFQDDKTKKKMLAIKVIHLISTNYMVNEGLVSCDLVLTKYTYIETKRILPESPACIHPGHIPCQIPDFQAWCPPSVTS